MGLDSKIITALYTTSNANYTTELCVEIAENFAISFAEWMLNTEYDLSGKSMTMTELLEIYKKTL